MHTLSNHEEYISILVVNLRDRGRYHSTQSERSHLLFLFLDSFSLYFLYCGEQLPFQRNDQFDWVRSQSDFFRNRDNLLQREKKVLSLESIRKPGQNIFLYNMANFEPRTAHALQSLAPQWRIIILHFNDHTVFKRLNSQLSINGIFISIG